MNADSQPDLICANRIGGTLTVLLNDYSPLSYTTAFTGNGAGLTTVTAASVAAANITGTVALAQLAASSVNSSKIVDGTIVNADINAAAIADTKLATISTAGKVADSALSANVSKLGSSIESSEITDGTIVDADINAAAAIADTKLATISAEGKVADSALSANVALLNKSPQTFTGTNLFTTAVSIGTASPGQMLQVGDSNSTRDGMIQVGAGNGLQQRRYNMGVPYGGTNIASTNYDFVITDTAGGVRLDIDWSTGNVGIGTTEPTEKLHVAGNTLTVGTNTAGYFTGNGAGLTNVTIAAANITGTVALAQLAANSVDGSKVVDGSIASADLAANSVDSSKIVDGTIVNADINAAAAIAYSKLNLAGSVNNGDIAANATIADTKLATISTAGKVADSAVSANVTKLGASIESSEIIDGTIVAADLAASLQPALVPIGSVIDWWRPNNTFPVPTGYKICDGSQVLDAASPYFGHGVPDLINRFIRGSDTNSIGSYVGADTHTHTVSATGTTGPAGLHNHQWGSSYRSGTTKEWRTYNAAGFASTMYSTTSDGIGGGSGQFPMRENNQGVDGTYPYYTTQEGDHTHSFSVGALSASGNNIPAYIGLLKIMRIK